VGDRAPVPRQEPLAADADKPEAATGDVPESATQDVSEPAAMASGGSAESRADEPSARSRPGKKARNRRSSVPSWDEIMLGSSRQRD
jgi:hypothetical protein